MTGGGAKADGIGMDTQPFHTIDGPFDGVSPVGIRQEDGRKTTSVESSVPRQVRLAILQAKRGIVTIEEQAKVHEVPVC